MNGIVLDWTRIVEHAKELPADRRDALIADADNSLKIKPMSVIDKTGAPPSGDKRDYMSSGPYWWPDPSKPDGLPYIRKDGQINPDSKGDRYDRHRLDKFCIAVKSLTLGHLLSGRKEFGEHTRELTRVWFINPTTRMNPHLRFGQHVPGVCDGRGIGIIDTRVFINVLDDLTYLARVGVIPADEIAATQLWFCEYLTWLLEHEYGKDERKEHNNHGTWWDVQACAFAIFCGRHEIAREILKSVPEQRIAKHIDADGKQPHEIARTRGLTYSAFNLQGMFALAWMGRSLEIDLWKIDRLKLALRFLKPFGEDKAVWPYQELKVEEEYAIDSRIWVRDLLRQGHRAWGDEFRVGLGGSSLAENRSIVHWGLG